MVAVQPGLCNLLMGNRRQAMTVSSAETANAIAFVGFGEAAHAFASGWQLPDGMDVRAYDVKLSDPEAAAPVLQRYSDAGVAPMTQIGDALDGAGLVF